MIGEEGYETRLRLLQLSHEHTKRKYRLVRSPSDRHIRCVAELEDSTKAPTIIRLMNTGIETV